MQIKEEYDGILVISRDGVEKRVLTWNEHLCVGCGICYDICPTKAITLGPLGAIAKGLVDAPKLDIDENTYVLCGICAHGCPFDAMDLKINGKSIKRDERYPKIKRRDIKVYQEICVLCGQCEIVCPQGAIDVERELPPRKNLVLGEITINKDKCVLCGI
ncbi:4Fe-4S ferredoxin iron-sulfur binding domain protein, partial [Methanotorris formicicus Mc-S-70]